MDAGVRAPEEQEGKKKILDGMDKEEFTKVSGQDACVLDNFEIFQKDLYKYLLDYTKNKKRSTRLAGKEGRL